MRPRALGPWDVQCHMCGAVTSAIDGLERGGRWRLVDLFAWIWLCPACQRRGQLKLDLEV